MRNKLFRLRFPSPKISTLGQVLSVALVVILAIVCITASQTQKDIRAIDRQWKELDSGPTARLQVLDGLRNAIGYGGFIHNFKNFILRKDQRLFLRATQDLHKAQGFIATYAEWVSTPDEKAALFDVDATINKYRYALFKADDLVALGLSAEEIDRQVVIADAPALRALRVLDEERLILRRQHEEAVQEHLTKAANHGFYQTAAISVSLCTIIVLLLFFIEGRVCAPLTRIVEAVKKLAEGCYSVSLPYKLRGDEIGEIARILDVWKHDASDKALLNRELERSVATMDLMNEITVAANLAFDRNEAFEKCLKLVCEFTGWEVGHIWEPANDGSGKIYPVDCWYFSDAEHFAALRKETNATVFSVGKGIPGFVCKSGDVSWVRCTDEKFRYPRMVTAKKCGMESAVGIPVKVMDEVAIVLEFFSSTVIERNSELLEILTHIGTQMGRVAERARWANEAVQHTEQLQEQVDRATKDLRKNAEELKQALEKEQELNALQRQFVSMASHEFRTPLAIIDGAAQRLLRRKGKMTEDDLVGRTQKIRAAVKRMSTLMESTLSAARMEAGALAVNIADCDIRAVVQDVCDRQGEIATNHKFELDLAGLPDLTRADAAALEQVFANLLSNAVKYSPVAPLIEVRGWQEGGDVFVSVRDHGLGIDEDELPKMFSRFFRARTSTGIAGTGIGLNLVKMLVEEHDGQVSVASKKGEGTTFTVCLPEAGPVKGTSRHNETELSEVA